MCGPLLPLPNTPSWRGVQLKNRTSNFAYCLYITWYSHFKENCYITWYSHFKENCSTPIWISCNLGIVSDQHATKLYWPSNTKVYRNSFISFKSETRRNRRTDTSSCFCICFIHLILSTLNNHIIILAIKSSRTARLHRINSQWKFKILYDYTCPA